MSAPTLIEIVRAESARPIPPAVRALADAARTQHPGSLGVLFHGSCLRESELTGRIVDLYVLVEHYATAHARRLATLANALLPPNVYYLEAGAGARRVRAKYAVVSLSQFERRLGARGECYFWARFCQPAALVWARDAAVRGRIEAALVRALETAMSEGALIALRPLAAAELWPRLFAETYRSELRAEGPERAEHIYAADAPRYERALEAAHAADPGLDLPPPAAQRLGAWLRWRRRRIGGKTLSVLRLMKAAFTFSGGADYLAWKIERHSGIAIRLTPWQRRHPILAGLWLSIGLRVKGAVR